MLTLGPGINGPASKALRLDGRLDSGVLSPALHQVLLNMARLRNVVSSLQIEGEKVDLAEARRVLDTEAPTTPREQEVLRFAKAYTDLHHRPEPPNLTVERIRRMHREFFENGTLEEGPIGGFKQIPNGVRDKTTGQWVFHATPPEETEAELEALLEWYHGDALSLPPAVAAGLFFVEFEAIHPFADGNGRLGRFLNLVALKHFGFHNACLTPIDGRFFRSGERYYEALAATNGGGNYHVWSRYYVKELLRAYEIADQRADLRTLLEVHTKPTTQDVLKWVLSGGASWFVHSDYPNPKGFSSTAVSIALSELVKEHVLEAEGEKRGRRYRLHPQFLTRLYNADFLGDTPSRLRQGAQSGRPPT